VEMKKLVRFLLAAILALAVPLQGALAVTAGQCMALGHHQSAAAQQSHGEARDGDGHAAHSHSESHQGVSDDAQGGDQSAADGAHCGPCTACCASASIAGPGAQSLVPSPFHAPYLFSQFPPLGVQPDGLYRPPLAL
jgi:hypothetical protein